MMGAITTHQVFDWPCTSGRLSEDDIARLPGPGIDAMVSPALPPPSNAMAGKAERGERT